MKIWTCVYQTGTCVKLGKREEAQEPFLAIWSLGASRLGWCSFHMLARSCWKSFKPGFNSMWTKNFQMYKLGLEKAEEPEVKLPTSVGSSKKQESSRKTSIFASLTTLKSLAIWITTNWKIIKEMGIPDHLTHLLRNLYVGQEATEPYMEQTGLESGKEYGKAVCCHPAYLTAIQSTSSKCRAGWIITWNQDCWEKYQQPQICRWYDSNGRKQRGTKEPLNEKSEKAGLKLNIHKPKIMASGPITSWQKKGKNLKQWQVSLLGLENHCGQWVQPCN